MEIGSVIILIVLYAVLTVDGVSSRLQLDHETTHNQLQPKAQNPYWLLQKYQTHPVSGRFFLGGDTIVKMVMENTDVIHPELKGPLLFILGFSQQSLENLVSNMRSLGQMLISSLVMMAVRRIYFADLPTLADRNNANQLTDAVLRIVDIFN